MHQRRGDGAIDRHIRHAVFMADVCGIGYEAQLAVVPGTGCGHHRGGCGAIDQAEGGGHHGGRVGNEYLGQGDAGVEGRLETAGALGERGADAVDA